MKIDFFKTKDKEYLAKLLWEYIEDNVLTLAEDENLLLVYEPRMKEVFKILVYEPRMKEVFKIRMKKGETTIGKSLFLIEEIGWLGPAKNYDERLKLLEKRKEEFISDFVKRWGE